MLIHKMPLYDTMVGVWHAVSATWIIGPIFPETLNSHVTHIELLDQFFPRPQIHVTHILMLFLKSYLSARELSSARWCKQFCMLFKDSFWDRIISREMWPPHSPKLDFYNRFFTCWAH